MHAHSQIIGYPLESNETLYIKASFRRLELINFVVEIDQELCDNVRG